MKLNTEDITIRNMTRNELDKAVSWAAKEGWNPGLHDADVFWNTDPDGFISLEKNGEMIGSGSVVSYDGNFGFMGFFIVKPEYRGQGLGTKLWFYRRDRLLSRLKKGASIGMDGVFAMQSFYAKGGFQFSHRDLRFEVVAKKEDYDENVKGIETADFEQIHEVDKKCFGFDRKIFLQGWLNVPESKAFKYINGSNLMGFGVIRKCQKGFKIGPLFAQNFETAHELFKAMSSFADGDLIYLDVPEINKEGMKLAKNYNMKECFGCARMYYGNTPKLPYERIFGVTTFELG